jgi:hypothetical protein
VSDKAVKHLRVLSLGAGVQSTTVYLLALNGKIPAIDFAIFADTQEEPRSVYSHLWWLAQQGAPILIDSVGSLGAHLQTGRNSSGGRCASIPAFTRPGWMHTATGMTRRQCTKEYKTALVEQMIRRRCFGLKPRQRLPKGTIVEYIFGISRDEMGRGARIQARLAKQAKWAQPQFPLIDMGWTRSDCKKWLTDHVPHEVPRSACVFCPFKSNDEWRRLKETDPEGWARAVEIDEALRVPGNVANRTYDEQLFVHRSARPLAQADLNQRQQSLGFAAECEGMCGV